MNQNQESQIFTQEELKHIFQICKKVLGTQKKTTEQKIETTTKSTTKSNQINFIRTTYLKTIKDCKICKSFTPG